MSKLLTSKELKNLSDKDLELEHLSQTELMNQIHCKIVRRQITNRYNKREIHEKVMAPFKSTKPIIETVKKSKRGRKAKLKNID